MRQLFSILIQFILFQNCYAGKVTGVVTDMDGKILPYASIFIKNTNRGTNANNEGKYSIQLEPGRYILVCQYVGYKKEEKIIAVGESDIEVNFKLAVQETVMAEVVLRNGEDPAYEIIRNAIKKRTYYQALFDKFQCQVYTKGQLKVRDYPNRILGQKIDFEDGDTSKNKIIYLSETISIYSVDKPDKEKVEVVSSRVSGNSDGYGLSAPKFFSMYDNNIFIGNNLNPRGFISPISDNALNYYKYKYEGEFVEDGRLINKIKVTPKRKYEPLFSGYINIVENDWLVHSLQLLLTRQSQMELIDSLRLDQIYRPLTGDTWVISSQVIYPSVKFFGFDAYGSFINIYSDFRINPPFAKNHFDNTVLKYVEGSNKKTSEYWEETRPIPLQQEETADYNRKDSLELAKKDPLYMDSLQKVRNKVNLLGLMLFEQTLVRERKRSSFTIRPITEQISFNPAEGWVINTGAVWSKRLDSSDFGRKTISLSPNLRYGFGNSHFNAHLTGQYNFGKRYASYIRLSGGKRVFQFNNNSPIGPRGNSLSCLLGEKNRMKTYEAWYVRGSYHQGIGQGFSWVAAFQYQDRMPLNNVTTYTWRNKKDREYTPNYPNELVSENIKRHQAFMLLFGMTWQPGTRYVELPEQKINIGSKYPVFSVQYSRSLSQLFGSDVDFSKWKFTVSDDMNFKLRGLFRYRLGVGGFIGNKLVEIPDFQHFNGNISTFATEYLNSFQLLPIYQFSNTSKFYALGHVEHNFNGFLTNKVPGLRQLNLYLVAGANGFYLKDDHYYEFFAGFDNIFKQFRFDVVQSFLNGKKFMTDFRIGLHRLGKKRGDDWP
jgi:hypothetical protein